MKHSEVPAALELVIEEVGKESQRIRDAGSEALKAGKLEPAKQAIAYAEQLADFVAQVRTLGERWTSLQGVLSEATQEVQEIVRFPKSGKPRKIGFTRKVNKVSPKTNFTVTFPDGLTISERQAKAVFAKTIEHIGVETVAALKIFVGGEPLVSQEKTAFQKAPTQIQPIARGWYVKTHNSTREKMMLLEKIAKVQHLKLKIQLCQ